MGDECKVYGAVLYLSETLTYIEVVRLHGLPSGRHTKVLLYTSELEPPVLSLMQICGVRALQSYSSAARIWFYAGRVTPSHVPCNGQRQRYTTEFN